MVLTLVRTDGPLTEEIKIKRNKQRVGGSEHVGRNLHRLMRRQRASRERTSNSSSMPG